MIQNISSKHFVALFKNSYVEQFKDIDSSFRESVVVRRDKNKGVVRIKVNDDQRPIYLAPQGVRKFVYFFEIKLFIIS